MKATLKEMEFMGQAGVGVYINDGLSSFVISATDLLATINALRRVGYNVITDEPELDH